MRTCVTLNSLPTMTVLQALKRVPSTRPERRGGSGPEIFTFDPLPEAAMAPVPRPTPLDTHRKRSRRVLYPRTVLRHLPPEEPNPAKRLLFLLLAVIFCQILMFEEEMPVPPLCSEHAPSDASPSSLPVSEPLNQTSESSDYLLDYNAFLQHLPPAF
ncbi:PREDICTED: radiation-inducible immediate-early gene IEX-1 [Elephantulus edwardii]|uniref:radiation-inducible immediate-early gene IEX-1 n=1 Tax=Elephantulus edwardii TaxID=28737 RepID=UPI0003F087FA|nr:PREDICTED: radiation-inducible immediate-early gene IEX-1 [Elephantulus edwardii]